MNEEKIGNAFHILIERLIMRQRCNNYIKKIPKSDFYWLRELNLHKLSHLFYQI